MGGVKLIACLAVATCYLNGVASYNPYAFASQFQGTADPDSYAAMGDIDWAKRSYDPVASALYYEPKRNNPKTYRSRQPYMQARPSYDQSATQAGKRGSNHHNRQITYQPYQAYARYDAIARPQTRKLGDRQYGYASMADMDWGWKKRSQWPAWFEVEDTENEEDNVEKRNLASLAKSNLYPVDHKLYSGVGKRFYDGYEGEFQNEEKRHIASIARAGRSVAPMAKVGMMRAP